MIFTAGELVNRQTQSYLRSEDRLYQSIGKLMCVKTILKGHTIFASECLICKN